MADEVPVLIVEDSLHMQTALRDLVQSVDSFHEVKTAACEIGATEWLLQQCAWKVTLRWSTRRPATRR